MVFSLGVLCYEKLSTFSFSILYYQWALLTSTRGQIQDVLLQLQVASLENNFLEEPSFLLSSFGIVVHMLKLVYHLQY